MNEIKPNLVYTTEETQSFLKISKSTVKRMLKSGLLRANKIGKQYRILGHEILRLVSPKLEQKTVEKYQSIKNKTRQKVRDW